jgi:hypothetical protein
LSPESVDAELQSIRGAIGRAADVAQFLRGVLQAASVPVQELQGAVKVELGTSIPRALRQALGRDDPFVGRFDLPLQDGELYLGRTSPVVEGLAGWTLDQALDPIARDGRSVASRCGVVSTSAVAVRTTLLVIRLRYHLRTGTTDAETILAEEILPLACTGNADAPIWLAPDIGEQLLVARPERNLVATAIEQQLGLLLAGLPKLQIALEAVAEERATLQLQAHERVREAARARGRVAIAPVLPVDILGAYVLLPKP